MLIATSPLREAYERAADLHVLAVAPTKAGAVGSTVPYLQ